MLTKEVVDTYHNIVDRVASDYARRYKMIERDDLWQELWFWFADERHSQKLAEWEEIGQKDADKLVARSLRNWAHDYCIKEKARVEGYEVDDLFWYTKQFVLDLIPAVLSEDWKRVQAALDGDARSKSNPAEAGNWMAYAADIRKAFSMLDEQEQNLVFLFYAQDVDGQTLLEQAAPEKPTARAAAMAANRALNKMIRTLGGFKPHSKEGDE